ncbi:hypothetical protein CL654_01190 [bacterium]|nr:hypothetical protein [bacterium]
MFRAKTSNPNEWGWGGGRYADYEEEEPFYLVDAVIVLVAVCAYGVWWLISTPFKKARAAIVNRRARNC